MERPIAHSMQTCANVAVLWRSALHDRPRTRPPPLHTGALLVGPLRLPALRAGSLYRTRYYAWLIGSNLVLRLAWAHRLVGNLESHAAVALAVALLEAFRRHQWAYVRVETEVRKLRLKAAHEHPLDGGEGAGGAGGGGSGELHSI